MTGSVVKMMFKRLITVTALFNSQQFPISNPCTQFFQARAIQAHCDGVTNDH